MNRFFNTKAFWFTVILLHLLYFAIQLSNGNWYLQDSYEYLQMAGNILTDGSFYAGDPNEPIDPDLYTKRPPLYPLFLILTFISVGAAPLTAFLQMLLSLLNIYLAIKLSEEFTSKSHRGIILLILLLSPAQFIYTQLIMSEIFFQTALISSLYFFVLYLKGERLKYLWLYNLILIGGMLIKPVLYLFIVPNLLFSGWLSLKNKSARPIFPALVPVLFALLYMGWNADRTGYFHYSSITNINLLHYNAYFMLLGQTEEEFANNKIDSIEMAAAAQPTYAAGEKLIQKESAAILKSRINAYTFFHLKGVMHFFIDPGRFDIYNFFGVKNEGGNGLLYYYSKDGYKGIFNYLMSQPIIVILALPLIVIGNLLKLAALLIFIFQKRVPLTIRILVLLLIGYIAFATGPLGASRFAIPLLPLFLFAVAIAWDRVRGKKADNN